MSCCTDNMTPCFMGKDTWSREARKVTLLASELTIALDDEALLLYDVRELTSLRVRLQRALGTPARRRGLRLGAHGISAR